MNYRQRTTSEKPHHSAIGDESTRRPAPHFDLRHPPLVAFAFLCFAACAADDPVEENATREAQSALYPGEYSLFQTSDVPNRPSDPDGAAVEVGVRIRADRDGMLTGIRFYKGQGNAGPHEGHVWSASGALLKSKPFGTETSSGWQTVRFSSPLAIRAGETYVASYHASAGHYAGDNDYFTTRSVDSGPLHAPKDAPTAHNGVYHYGASAFPADSYRGSNYWVDVFFAPTDTAPDAGSSPVDAGAPSVDAAATDAAATVDAQGPTPPYCTTTAVWQNLKACGWAGPGNTGVPTGTTFAKTVTGGLSITVDGTVIDRQDISGGVKVFAKNVVIRNSRIRMSANGANGSGVVNVTPGASAVIEDSTLDGQNATHACVWHEGSTMAARRNECLGVNDGIFAWATSIGVNGAGDNFDIEDNYFHAFTLNAGNGHVDGFQTEGAIHGVIRHNTFDIPQSQTSNVAIWNSRKTSDDITIDRNLMSGSGFSIYVQDYSPSETSPAGGYAVTNVRVTNNRFSTLYYGCSGRWGVWYPRGNPTDGWHRSGNFVLETGQNVDTQNPTFNGAPCN